MALLHTEERAPLRSLAVQRREPGGRCRVQGGFLKLRGFRAEGAIAGPPREAGQKG